MLMRSVYGNVDTAMLWMKQFTKTVTENVKFNLLQSKTDPCMFFRIEHDEAVLIVIVYVELEWMIVRPMFYKYGEEGNGTN